MDDFKMSDLCNECQNLPDDADLCQFCPSCITTISKALAQARAYKPKGVMYDVVNQIRRHEVN